MPNIFGLSTRSASRRVLPDDNNSHTKKSESSFGYDKTSYNDVHIYSQSNHKKSSNENFKYKPNQQAFSYNLGVKSGNGNGNDFNQYSSDSKNNTSNHSRSHSHTNYYLRNKNKGSHRVRPASAGSSRLYARDTVSSSSKAASNRSNSAYWNGIHYTGSKSSVSSYDRYTNPNKFTKKNNGNSSEISSDELIENEFITSYADRVHESASRSSHTRKKDKINHTSRPQSRSNQNYAQSSHASGIPVAHQNRTFQPSLKNTRTNTRRPASASARSSSPYGQEKVAASSMNCEMTRSPNKSKAHTTDSINEKQGKVFFHSNPAAAPPVKSNTSHPKQNRPSSAGGDKINIRFDNKNLVQENPFSSTSDHSHVNSFHYLYHKHNERQQWQKKHTNDTSSLNSKTSNIWRSFNQGDHKNAISTFRPNTSEKTTGSTSNVKSIKAASPPNNSGISEEKLLSVDCGSATDVEQYAAVTKQDQANNVASASASGSLSVSNSTNTTLSNSANMHPFRHVRNHDFMLPLSLANRSQRRNYTSTVSTATTTNTGISSISNVTQESSNSSLVNNHISGIKHQSNSITSPQQYRQFVVNESSQNVSSNQSNFAASKIGMEETHAITESNSRSKITTFGNNTILSTDKSNTSLDPPKLLNKGKDISDENILIIDGDNEDKVESIREENSESKKIQDYDGLRKNSCTAGTENQEIAKSEESNIPNQGVTSKQLLLPGQAVRHSNNSKNKIESSPRVPSFASKSSKSIKPSTEFPISGKHNSLSLTPSATKTNGFTEVSDKSNFKPQSNGHKIKSNLGTSVPANQPSLTQTSHLNGKEHKHMNLLRGGSAVAPTGSRNVSISSSHVSDHGIDVNNHLPGNIPATSIFGNQLMRKPSLSVEEHTRMLQKIRQMVEKEESERLNGNTEGAINAYITHPGSNSNPNITPSWPRHCLNISKNQPALVGTASDNSLCTEKERKYLIKVLTCPPLNFRGSSEFYLFSQVLGQGSFAKVRLAKHKLSAEQVAVKTYEKSKLRDQKHLKRVLQEVKLMEKFDHPKVIRLFEAFESPKRVHIVMEYVKGTNLCAYVKEKKRLQEPEARRIFAELCDALIYIHDLGIVHRDIKLENVLLDTNNKVKLVDFGFSISCKDKKLHVFCGTPSYMAPEIVKRKEYHGKPVDIWSMGVVLYALLCGRFPFSAQSYPDLYKKIAKGHYHSPEDLSSGAKDIISRLLVVDPNVRYTLDQIVEHSWISNDFSQVSTWKTSNKATDNTIPFTQSGNSHTNQNVQNNSNSTVVVNKYVLSKLEGVGINRNILLAHISQRKKNCLTTTYDLLHSACVSAGISPNVTSNTKEYAAVEIADSFHDIKLLAPDGREPGSQTRHQINPKPSFGAASPKLTSNLQYHKRSRSAQQSHVYNSASPVSSSYKQSPSQRQTNPSSSKVQYEQRGYPRNYYPPATYFYENNQPASYRVSVDGKQN